MARKITSKQTLTLIVAIISLFIYYGQEMDWFAKAADTLETHQPGTYAVTRFSDGDTIVVDMNGTPETIRFIGVDTPETHDPRKAVQCYGPAASAFTKNVIRDQRVRLSADALSSNRDRYNRLLRYVYLLDGTLLNERLIREGYGFYYPYFPFTKSEQFDAAQKLAIADVKGLWANCTPVMNERGGYTSNDQ